MKTFLLLVLAISLSLFTGCSDNSSIIPDYNPPCSEETSEILSLPGSPDAPVLYLDTGAQSTDAYLYWTEIEGAYYEVEEGDCPCFNCIIYTYYVYDNLFANGINNAYFYRVRAITGSGLTGWSNVVAGSHGGIL